MRGLALIQQYNLRLIQWYCRRLVCTSRHATRAIWHTIARYKGVPTLACLLSITLHYLYFSNYITFRTEKFYSVSDKRSLEYKSRNRLPSALPLLFSGRFPSTSRNWNVWIVYKTWKVESHFIYEMWKMSVWFILMKFESSRVSSKELTTLFIRYILVFKDPITLTEPRITCLPE